MGCIIVSEIGINHNGSISLIKKMIDASVLGGTDYVKFQKRTIDQVYTEEELNKERESPWGTTNRQQKEGLELDTNGYDEIDIYCKQKGIKWFASPWDLESVRFLVRYSPDYIKVASACMCNFPLLEEIKRYKIPVIVSTGMISKEELDKALDVLGGSVEFILSCTSTYPTSIEDMNMRQMITLREIYGRNYKIGFSNHSPGITFILMAATLGAEMIEYHMTLDRSMYGSDQAASIEIPGVMKIGTSIRDIERSWGSGEIKCLDSELSVRKKLMKEIS